MFPDRSHDEFYFHQLSDLGHYGSVIFTVDDNIINQTYKTEIEQFDEIVMNISVQSADGQTYFYRDLCARNKNKCSVWGLWYLDEFFWKEMESGKVTADGDKIRHGYGQETLILS
jgi:hypothetical protein